MVLRIGIVGLGKIAHDQHLPIISALPEYELVAAASLEGESPRGRTYRSVEAMLIGEPHLDAVALCQPPQARFEAARLAFAAGKHVLLENPPGGTLSEVVALADLARKQDRTLFATWHSRHAPAVEPARAWLASRCIRSASIIWKEDVRVWHPGQAWIWQPGGLGVFDPGINALSIATYILPSFFLTRGSLSVPANRAAPIAASLHFETTDGVAIDAEFDWRQSGEQTWDIRVETDEGRLLLSKGGAALSIAGEGQPLGEQGEYRGIYKRFSRLIAEGESDVDLSPLRHVADAFLRADRANTQSFIDEE
jgi:D-galactose 1-dehydrogenase